MARSILETKFTGNDSHFQRAAKRVEGGGKSISAGMLKVGAVAAGAAAAIAAVGAVLSRTVTKFDRVGKVASRLGASAEDVQRLSFVAEQSGADFERLQTILTRLQRRIGEAIVDPASSAAKAFARLGLSAEALSKKDLMGQFADFSDAFRAADPATRMADGMKLLDTEFREFVNLADLGGDAIREMGGSINVVSNENVRNMERLSNAINFAKTQFQSFVGNAIGPMIGGLWKTVDAIDQVRAGFDLMGHAAAAAANIMSGAMSPAEGGSLLEAERDRIDKWLKDRAEKRAAILDGIINGKAGAGGAPAGDGDSAAAAASAAAGSALGVSRRRDVPIGFDVHGRRSGAPLSKSAEKSNAQRATFFKDAKKAFSNMEARGERIEAILDAALVS